MKITEEVRKYAVELQISEDKALAKGMEEKSKEFVQSGAEVYTKGWNNHINQKKQLKVWL